MFDGLNRDREAMGEAPFANPRNAASGTLKLLDPKTVASRRLDSFIYFVMGEDLPTDCHFENLAIANQWGLKTSKASKKCKTLQEIFDFLDYWDVERKNLPVATDGAVLKVNSLQQQKNLGFTSKFPRWAIAYKFEAPEAETVVEGIDVQVGRTGRITPVARVKPVRVGNSVVSNVTLHNQDYINLLELALQDRVSISKRGDVIPAVERVLEKNEAGYKTWLMPLE